MNKKIGSSIMALVSVIATIFYLLNFWAVSVGSDLGAPGYYSSILLPASLIALVFSICVVVFSIKVYNHPDRQYPVTKVYVSYLIVLAVVTYIFWALTHGVIG